MTNRLRVGLRPAPWPNGKCVVGPRGSLEISSNDLLDIETTSASVPTQPNVSRTPIHPSMSKLEVLHAYRRLFKLSQRAILNARPARYQVRDIIRNAFRSEPRSSFNPRRVENTAYFLTRARNYNGFEHKILKNLLFIRWWRTREHHGKLLRAQTNLAADVRKNMWAQYDATLAMLNESQDLCLRI